VAHVLNGTAPISDEVRGRVMDATKELGYLEKRSGFLSSVFSQAVSHELRTAWNWAANW
jgi:hypothetical protein